MNILGISCYYHNSASCLFKNGIPIAMAEEERFTRVKNDSSYPSQAIDFCLSKAKIKSKDLDYVIFYEKPFIKFERLIQQSVNYYPKSWKFFREAMLDWLINKLWIKEKIATNLAIHPQKIYFSDHHLSHAASAFLPSPFKDAAILTVDGVGEWSTTTIGRGSGTDIRLYEEIKFPHSIGLLYSAFTAYLGFEVNEGEYKVMGMAAFGKPKYINKIKKTISLYNDGSYRLNLKYFSHQYSSEKSYSDKLVGLLGPQRNKNDNFFTAKDYPAYFGKKPKNFNKLAEKNQYYADIAASLQLVTEEVLLGLVKKALSIANSRNLCYAGGVALNSLANGKIIKLVGSKNIFIQPASGDSGGALGAAYYLESLLSKKRRFKQIHCYFGKDYSKENIAYILKNNKKRITHKYYSKTNNLNKVVVNHLVNNKVIGWFQGKFEWGPRALGNRSIIASPTHIDMKNIVNTTIKFREPFRPFAPSVLKEYVSDFFEYEVGSSSDPAFFMLAVTNIKKEKRKLIPAVTHVDGTGRLQVVDQSTNLRYYNLINTFRKQTGIPLILNTSFNLKGEPIVNTPENALDTFFRSQMDILVLENFIIEKK